MYSLGWPHCMKSIIGFNQNKEWLEMTSIMASWSMLTMLFYCILLLSPPWGFYKKVILDQWFKIFWVFIIEIRYRYIKPRKIWKSRNAVMFSKIYIVPNCTTPALRTSYCPSYCTCAFPTLKWEIFVIVWHHRSYIC